MIVCLGGGCMNKGEIHIHNLNSLNKYEEANTKCFILTTEIRYK